MNALFQNLNLDIVSNSPNKNDNPNVKGFHLYSKINDSQYFNTINTLQKYNLLLNNEEINQLAQSLNSLNSQYIKERQNITNEKNPKNDYVKNSLNESKISNKQEINNDKKNKNNVDSFSEIKKFKTELCHSWELTGTCKYGLNVSYINYINILLIILLYYSVFLLME